MTIGTQEAALFHPGLPSFRSKISAYRGTWRAPNATVEKLQTPWWKKEAEAQAVRDQLNSLTSQLEELHKPWWKKWFLLRPTDN
ncbi:MAG: hypothetical protein HC888_02175 [Candidatus Competibacteraceae bacterium]|nr:hypothetical protein [Candidatus Competibacteraceae bacterium]